jgi:hypothetical protein
MADMEKLDENLPAIIPDFEEAWRKVCKRDFGPRMMRALQRVAAGSTAKEAAKAEGFKMPTDVYRRCKEVGLVNTKTQFIINRHAAIASLSGAELERRLLEEPEAVTAPQLAVINGISTDKLLVYEKNAKSDGADYMSALEVAAKIAADGGSMELKVTVRPAVAEPVISESDIIDVTPVEGA